MSIEVSEAKQALRRAAAAAQAAQVRRVEAERRWPIVREITAAVRRQRENNHFAEALTAIFRGRP
jgi:hypothetical protein